MRRATDSIGGPVFPEACAAQGERLRSKYLSALDSAVDAALSETIARGGVCEALEKGETSVADGYPVSSARSPADTETPRVQAARSAVSDGRFVDFTASSYPSEVLRLSDLLSEKPALTRITVERQAVSLLQVDGHLLVFSQKETGNAASTRIDIFDGRPALPIVTRGIDLDGEVVSAFRAGSTAYVVMRRAAFNPFLDPTALIPKEINCKAASREATAAAFEALRLQLKKRITTSPLNLSPAITEHRARGGVRNTEVVSDCGGVSGDISYVYVVALRPVGAVPVTVQVVEPGSLLVNVEEGVVLDAAEKAGQSLPNPLPVYSLSGASIDRMGSLSTEGNVPGAFAADFEGGRLRIFSATGKGGLQTALSTWTLEGNAFRPIGMGSGPTPPSSCEIRQEGWKAAIPPGTRATAFTKDRAFAAVCRGLEVWTAGNGPPRSVSTLEDNSVVLHLSFIDETHLLAAGYALDAAFGAKGIFLRIIDVKNPMSPKVIHHTIAAGSADFPYLRAQAIHVQGNMVALPIVFGRGKTSGAVFVYRFDVDRGFKPAARIPYGARREDGRPAGGDQVFLKTGRVFTVTDDFLQINRIDHPETVLFSTSR